MKDATIGTLEIAEDTMLALRAISDYTSDPPLTPEVEATIRQLRRKGRATLDSTPDLTHLRGGGVTLSPEWEDGKLIGWEVLVLTGFIKP